MKPSLMEKGFRLIGFGRYAGIAGAYNGFRTWGLKYNLWDLPKAGNYTRSNGFDF
jgi:hypothetical protein